MFWAALDGKLTQTFGRAPGHVRVHHPLCPPATRERDGLGEPAADEGIAVNKWGNAGMAVGLSPRSAVRARGA
jgi:hypothetical protein